MADSEISSTSRLDVAKLQAAGLQLRNIPPSSQFDIVDSSERIDCISYFLLLTKSYRTILSNECCEVVEERFDHRDKMVR